MSEFQSSRGVGEIEVKLHRAAASEWSRQAARHRWENRQVECAGAHESNWEASDFQSPLPIKPIPPPKRRPFCRGIGMQATRLPLQQKKRPAGISSGAL